MQQGRVGWIRGLGDLAALLRVAPNDAQALALQPAQGGFVELSFPEAGNYPFVTHIMSNAEKGAKGVFHVGH